MKRETCNPDRFRAEGWTCLDPIKHRHPPITPINGPLSQERKVYWYKELPRKVKEEEKEKMIELKELHVKEGIMFGWERIHLKTRKINADAIRSYRLP
ncbi:hypothetical protein E2C01_000252 [Portunus trituberculatus]|uniref:Uncharacterized protein n=1 Tax=Portunus trituberculatus TaxID=210409 RepID=A0A5B7CE67_PORTR|nr:hypothetical protein [Portunus trituberculatus]